MLPRGGEEGETKWNTFNHHEHRHDGERENALHPQHNVCPLSSAQHWWCPKQRLVVAVRALIEAVRRRSKRETMPLVRGRLLVLARLALQRCVLPRGPRTAGVERLANDRLEWRRVGLGAVRALHDTNAHAAKEPRRIVRAEMQRGGRPPRERRSSHAHAPLVLVPGRLHPDAPTFRASSAFDSRNAWLQVARQSE